MASVYTLSGLFEAFKTIMELVIKSMGSVCLLIIFGVCFFFGWKVVTTHRIFTKEDPTPEEWEGTENKSGEVMDMLFRKKGML